MPLTHMEQGLRDTARIAFWQGFTALPSLFDGLVHVENSTADQETYAWLAYAVPVREFKGQREKNGVPEVNYTIVNKKWEATVVFDYMVRKYGKNNVVAKNVMQMGQKARDHRDKLLTQVLQLGISTACYDTQFFFDTDHVEVGGSYTTSQDNDKTSAAATTTIPTDLEFASAMRTAQSTLFGYKDGVGDPFWPGDSPTFIAMVPPEYRSISLAVQNNEFLTGQVSNDLRGTFTTRVNPHMLPTTGSTQNQFVLFNASHIQKPLILQVAEDVTIEDDMGGDDDFNTKDVSFGSWAIYNAGYGQWRTALSHIFS
jgi:phage major head subunit gpT-like protein